jgi:hypothetical protein
VHGISDTSVLLDNSDIGASVQGYSAKTAAIAALTWAANNIILLTGTATAAVQALAAHVVTFLGSASAADARAAIGAGTGSGDVTGPGSSVDNAIPRFHETTGKVIQGGTEAPTYDDIGNLVLGPSRYVDVSTYRPGGGNNSLFYDKTGTATTFRIEHVNRRISIGSNVFPRGTIHSYDVGGFMVQGFSGVNATPQTVYANVTGDVTLALTGMFVVSDGAGNTAAGTITKIVPSGTFNLYDDGGTNTCQLQVAADGSVVVVRTAGSRTYTIMLTLLWL